MPPDRELVEEWFELADADLDLATHLLREGRAHLLGYLLQQAAEKSLKGFLESRESRPPKIHDLSGLLSRAAALEPGLERHRRVCVELSTQYMAARYPGRSAVRATLEKAADLLPLVQALQAEMRKLAGL
jgi:HEPN domain-containing protein